MSAAVEIVEATARDRDAWESFVASETGAEAGHVWGFHDHLARTFGQAIVRLVARREGGIAGILPLVYQGSVLGRFLTSVPYLNYAGILASDPDARRALAASAVERARSLRADRLEIRGRDGSDLPIEAWRGKATYALALARDPEAVWSGLGTKMRTRIRRAAKGGYEARVAAGDGCDLFYPILAKRWHQLGSPVIPEAFFRGFEDAFRGRFEYVVVEKAGAPVAAGALLEFGGRVEIPWAASRTDHDRFGVNMLLYWTCIERAVARGASAFDFGRSTPGTGTAEFKLQWGAKETPLVWNVHAQGSGGRAAERGDARRGLAATAWSFLPAFLAARIGPPLAARIPY
jgi:FemAB-related protein (PEP-CTERM system-associated)